MAIAVNALAAQIERNAVETPAGESLALPASAPDGLAAARFETIMKSSEVDKAGPSQSATVPAAGPAAQPSSLGDRLLASLQGASEDYKGVRGQVEARLESDKTLEMHEMMAMQLQITRVAVAYDLFGKLVSRSTQNFDQLVRVQ